MLEHPEAPRELKLPREPSSEGKEPKVEVAQPAAADPITLASKKRCLFFKDCTLTTVRSHLAHYQHLCSLGEKCTNQEKLHLESFVP